MVYFHEGARDLRWPHTLRRQGRLNLVMAPGWDGCIHYSAIASAVKLFEETLEIFCLQRVCCWILKGSGGIYDNNIQFSSRNVFLLVKDRYIGRFGAPADISQVGRNIDNKFWVYMYPESSCNLDLSDRTMTTNSLHKWNEFELEIWLHYPKPASMLNMHGKIELWCM